MELMSNRDLVLELATSSDDTYALDPKLQVLINAGEALKGRLDQIRRVARDLDALLDPATIMEVA
jgi:hypothetical protein